MRLVIKFSTIAALGLAVLSGCGFLEQLKLKPSQKALRGSDDRASGDLGGEEVVLDLTAEYENKPVDILLLRERSSYFRANNGTPPFPSRLNRTESGGALALKSLGVRMYNSGLDLRFAVAEAVFANNSDEDQLVEDSSGNGLPLFWEGVSSSFADDTFERTRHTNGDRNNANLLFPLKAIDNILDGKGNSSGFLRDGATLAILYVALSDEAMEGIDTASIIEKLDNSRGKDNWKVSVIAPPKEGCGYTTLGNSPTDTHTNADDQAADSSDPSSWASYTRKNKMIRLQEYSKGLFNSLCDDNYSELIDKFTTDGTNSAFFNITLEKKPDPTTISVTVDDSPVEGWEYHENGQILRLPKTIANGTSFRVTYKTPGSNKVHTGAGNGDGDISDVTDRNLSPSELAFVELGIANVLNNCGCHNNQAPTFNNSFNSAYNLKEQIANSINNDSMPPAGPLNQAQKDAIREWSLID